MFIIRAPSAEPQISGFRNQPSRLFLTDAEMLVQFVQRTSKDLAVGDTVLKYGEDIGKVVAPIRKGDHQQSWIALAPAPPEIAVQVYNRGSLPTMLAKLQSGMSIKDVQDWAEDELGGFVR